MTKKEVLGSPDFYLNEFSTLPSSPATLLFQGWACQNLKMMQAGEISRAEAIIRIGVSFVHARLHAGWSVDWPVEEVGEDGWVLPRFNVKYTQLYDRGAIGHFGDRELHGWILKRWVPENEADRIFARVAIPAYREAFVGAANDFPGSAIFQTEKLFPPYFESAFGIGYSPELAAILFNPRVVMLPCDWSESQDGDFRFHRHPFWQTHIAPPDLTTPALRDTMKAWAFPATMFLSSYPANSFPEYIEWDVIRKRRLGEGADSIAKAVSLTARHERGHLLVDPLVFLAMRGGPYCWFTEGIASFLEGEETIRFLLRGISRPPMIEEVIDTAQTSVDYNRSLLLTMAMALRYCRRMEQLADGVTRLLSRVAQRADEVAKGKQPKLSSPSALFNFLEPEAETDEGRADLEERIRRVLRHYNK